MDEGIRTTRYFEEQIRRKRPYIDRAWCEQALRSPERMELEGEERVFYWLSVPELRRPLRVVTLGDGKTVHDAYLDSTVVQSS